MAGDTLATGGGERVGWHEKVRRAKDGRIYGCSGDAADSIWFGRWIDGEWPKGEKPDLAEKFEALILSPNGTVEWIGKALEPLPYFAPMTIGSGAGLALGAMLAGKSPEEAVAIAIERDINSGGNITVIRIDEPEDAAGFADRLKRESR